MHSGEHSVGAAPNASLGTAPSAPLPRRKTKRGKRTGVGRPIPRISASTVPVAPTSASGVLQAQPSPLSLIGMSLKSFSPGSQLPSVSSSTGPVYPPVSSTASQVHFGHMMAPSAVAQAVTGSTYHAQSVNNTFLNDPSSKFSSLRPNERAAAVDYDHFLSELTFNSKDVINNLTKIAGENVASCNAIATAVELRVLMVSSHAKLPLLYVVDSICKNIGGVYVQRFKQGIFRCFACAYESADSAMRASMLRMLNTWPPVFGPELVASIHRHVEVVDGMSHSEPIQSSYSGSSPYGTTASIMSSPYFGASFQYNVISQIDRLYADITHKVVAGIHPSPLDISTLSTLISGQLQNVSTSPYERNKLFAMQRHVHSLAQGFSSASRNVSSITSNGALTPQHGAPVVSAPSPLGIPFPGHLPLRGNPMTSVPIPRSIAPAQNPEPGTRSSPVLQYSNLKSVSHADVVRSLYTELAFLSKSDGMRFKTQLALRNHLDWLFEQNKRKRARQRIAGGSSVSRCWYDRTSMFLGESSALKAASMFAKPGSDGRALPGSMTMIPSDHTNDQGNSQSSTENDEQRNLASERVACEANGDNEICPACLEGFQTSWDDDRQAWILHDGVRADDDGRAYHPGCFDAVANDGDTSSVADVEDEVQNNETLVDSDSSPPEVASPIKVSQADAYERDHFVVQGDVNLLKGQDLSDNRGLKRPLPIISPDGDEQVAKKPLLS